MKTKTKTKTKKTTMTLTMLATLALAACGAQSSGPHPDGLAANGEALFTTNCTSCHGGDARSGSAGENLPGAVADDGVDEIFDIILNGKDNGEMPAFADVLSEQEIADVIAWIETQ